MPKVMPIEQAESAIPPAAEREVWTVQDVAEFLLISPRHVTNLANRGALPGKKFGVIWRFRKQDIVSFR